MMKGFYVRGTKGKDAGDTSATTRRGQEGPVHDTITTKENSLIF
jgi:hypothetical protein